MPMAPTRTQTSHFHGPLEPGSVVQVSLVTDTMAAIRRRVLKSTSWGTVASEQDKALVAAMQGILNASHAAVS